jgi:hypothetical protein
MAAVAGSTWAALSMSILQRIMYRWLVGKLIVGAGKTACAVGEVMVLLAAGNGVLGAWF